MKLNSNYMRADLLHTVASDERDEKVLLEKARAIISSKLLSK